MSGVEILYVVVGVVLAVAYLIAAYTVVSLEGLSWKSLGRAVILVGVMFGILTLPFHDAIARVWMYSPLYRGERLGPHGG